MTKVRATLALALLAAVPVGPARPVFASTTPAAAVFAFTGVVTYNPPATLLPWAVQAAAYPPDCLPSLGSGREIVNGSAAGVNTTTDATSDPAPGTGTATFSLSEPTETSTCDSVTFGEFNLAGSMQHVAISVPAPLALVDCYFADEELSHDGAVLNGQSHTDQDTCTPNGLSPIPVFAQWKGTYTPAPLDASGRFSTAVIAGTLTLYIGGPLG